MPEERLSLDGVTGELARRGRNWVARRQDVPIFPKKPPPDLTLWEFALRELRKLSFPAPDSPEVNWRTQATLSPARNQGNFSTCSAFAICGAAEDTLAIRRPGTAPRLSPGHCHVCIGRESQNDPIDLGILLSAVVSAPLAREQPGDYPFPEDRCGAVPLDARISSFTKCGSAAGAQQALQAGPVAAVIDLWEDFHYYYSGGIYQYVKGDYLGTHSVEVIGCNPTERCWVIKNSFGPTWGEFGGFARIAFGQCRLFSGHQGYAISVN